MEVLCHTRTSLRTFLLQAAVTCANERDRTALETAVRRPPCPELKRLLHETVVYNYYQAASPYPRLAWSTVRSLHLSEVIALVIERLLTRRRADPSDSNLLTLGYRDVAPGTNGHRVTASNSVMCYFPNTLVATLKTAVWESLHALIGDDLLVHLLLNYCIFVKVPQPSGSYVQIAGNSLRWMKRPAPESAQRTRDQHQTKKRKSSAAQARTVPPAKEPHSSTISINHVMYARHFQKRKLFAKTEIATAASTDSDGSISRGKASRLICSMFPDVKNEKRLPKRLVNLVPIAQQLLHRVQTADIDAIISKVLPMPPELRTFLQDHQHVRGIMFAASGSGERTDPSTGNRTLNPLIARIADEGYQSQPESQVSRESRKRKRVEDAVATISSNSETVSTGKKVVRRVHFNQEVTSKGDDLEPQLGMGQLTQLQRHRHEIASLLQMTVSPRTVRRLLRKVLAAVVPKSLFGEASTNRQHSNWSKVKQLVDRLVTSRKYDILSIDRMAAEFKVKDINWMDASGKSMCPPNELKARQILVSQVMTWVMRSIVFPVLRNCFYITESEGSANQVFYYSRPVWTIISTLAMYDLTSFILKPTTSELVMGNLGSSRLRLLPKINGVRPLMNLSGKTLGADVSVNRSLELVHRALLFEIDRQSDRLLGATVRNVDEIHTKLKKLICGIRECRSCVSTGGPTLYCVAVDVERCFDTIRPKKLMWILKKVFAEEEYLVRKHWVCKGAYYKMERPAFPSGDLKGYDQLVQDTGKKRDAVFVDGVLYDYITKAKILSLLREHLSANTVQANDQLYTQHHGIPQGSVLSTALCNLYYANFEKRVLLKQLKSVSSCQTDVHVCNHELLMRYTDDFLFVSTSLEKARGFAELMHSGNQDYGCYVNPKKSQVNFPVFAVDGNGVMQEIPRFDMPGGAVDTTADSDASHVLAWCGLLFDPKSLQVYVNYDKVNLSVVAASIPLDDTKNIGAVFVNKVISAIRQRWHRLYFDPETLYPSTIQINLYQMLCLAAVRLVLLVDKLPAASLSFLYECIHKVILRTSRGIQRTLMEGNKLQQDAVQDQILRIGLFSFSVVIKGTKLHSSIPSKSTSGNNRSTAPNVIWKALVKQIDRDQACQHTSRPPSHFSKDGQASSTNTTRALDELEHDPHNAIVGRWITDYAKTYK